MVRNVRAVALLVVLAAVAIGACTPVKPPAPPPGRSIAYYYVEDHSLDPETGAFRSSTPGARPISGGTGTARQQLIANGSVLLQVDNAGCPCGATSGFYTNLFRLGDLTSASVHVSPGSTPVELNLVIDESGNGEWAEWDANGQRIGFGGDDQGFGPVTSGGLVSIDDDRRFALFEAGSFPSLGELKAGAQLGIDADTLVGLQVLTEPGEDATTNVISLQLNGVELL